MKTTLLCSMLIFELCQLSQANAQAVAELKEPLQTDSSQALEEYLAKPDDTYRWKKIRGGTFEDAKYVELILHSQSWREITWKHQLWILRPKKVTSEQAVLLITGGTWSDELEEADYPTEIPGQLKYLANLAREIEAPVAVIMQVPNQPLFDGMVEDNLISYTFEQFMVTGEADWPLLLPMVKSAIRAMDAVEEYCEKFWLLPIESFTVTGASKRGWTTWLTGASDSRVNAIAPMVIDILNMSPQMDHQLEVWGDFSKEISEYTSRGLHDILPTPGGQKLAAVVDPYSYRKSLTMPKLIINGTNDPYWPVDALNFYWEGLPSQKHALYVPNGGHGFESYDRVLGGIAALHCQADGQKNLPKIKYSFQEDGDSIRLTMESDQPVDLCQVWQADAPQRDFRASNWNATELSGNGKKYEHVFQKPATGSLAVFGELIYRDRGFPLYLSTNMHVEVSEATANEAK